MIGKIVIRHTSYVTQGEKFEDTKEIIRIRKSKRTNNTMVKRKKTT